MGDGWLCVINWIWTTKPLADVGTDRYIVGVISPWQKRELSSPKINRSQWDANFIYFRGSERKEKTRWET
jgi:hypothetical protein